MVAEEKSGVKRVKMCREAWGLGCDGRVIILAEKGGEEDSRFAL